MGVTALSAEGTVFAKAQMGETAGQGGYQELQAVGCCRSLNRKARDGERCSPEPRGRSRVEELHREGLGWVMENPGRCHASE